MLRKFGIAAFTWTFGHLYPSADLKHYLDESYTLDTFNKWACNPDYILEVAVTWVGDAGGVDDEKQESIVGYVLAGPNELSHADVTPHCLEIKRLYIAPEMFGTGVADRLLGHALEWVSRKKALLPEGEQYVIYFWAYIQITLGLKSFILDTDLKSWENMNIL